LYASPHRRIQSDAAVASYEKAIALDPYSPTAHRNLGNALAELNQLEAAVASYDKALALKPDYAAAGWSK
jgi:tetratricopeptide (TPR) repeat protein